jgi:signal transduction histidine kinase
MKKAPTQTQIEALQSAFLRLKEQPLPSEAVVALEKAAQYLNELSNYVKDSQEQARLAALYKVSQAMGASLDLDEVLTQVIDAAIHLTGAERGFLVLAGSGEGDWVVHAARNFNGVGLQPDEMGVSRTVITSVFQTKQALVTTDARNDPRFARQESVVLMALRSILCAPLMARGQVIGVIYVDNRAQTGLFTRADLDLLNALAVQAAVAIENARLYTRTDQELSQQVAELERLTMIDRELNASLDLEHVLEITKRWAIRATGASNSWVLLTNTDGGTNFQDINPSLDLPLNLDRALVEAALHAGSPDVFRSSDGNASCLFAPILHAGQVLGVLIGERQGGFDASAERFLQRLSARAAPALANARLYGDVQRANQEKSRFVSIVTHELRTPLTSIKGFTDLLHQGAVGALNVKQLSFLDIILNNVDRMSALVSDLSDISHIETGRLKLEPVATELQGLVSDCLRSLSPKLDEKHQALDVVIAPELPPAYVDPNRLVQVLNNLMSNAWKYTPEGGSIHVAVRRQGSALYLEISDNGIGIRSEDQARLFTQFFRSEDPDVRDQPGWGLGLNVSKRLIELMGGTIGVESVVGQGSKFRLTLPIAKDST